MTIVCRLIVTLGEEIATASDAQGNSIQEANVAINQIDELT
jgi:methyl-accepting chemotaxis protein